MPSRSFSALWIGLAVVGTAWAFANSRLSLVSSNEWIGCRVVTPKGEDLGLIDDAIVHSGARPAYAVMSVGTWLGMENKLIAMPWTVLRAAGPELAKIGPGRVFVLSVERERLALAPSFEKSSWPSLTSPEWSREVDAFYASDVNPLAAKAPSVEEAKARLSWRATELRGQRVDSTAGAKLGEIRDLALDTHGRVCYAAVSSGGMPAAAVTLVAVPWEAFTFRLGGESRSKKTVQLATESQKLAGAPAYLEGRSNSARMSDPKWVASVYAYFDVEPYWDTSAVEPESSAPKK